MTGLHLKADGTVETFVFDTSDCAEKIHKLIGGWLEPMPQNFHSRITMYADEDGKRKGKPLNMLATLLSGLWPQDVIVGDVVVVGAPDSQGDDQGLPTDVIEAVRAIDTEASWQKLINRQEFHT